MKVACPQCGQHYEIDSNMLDRYYRCTECKTLFWGLKAKSVKPVVYKVKENPESGEAEELLNGDEAAGTPVVAGEDSAAVADVSSENKDKEEILIAPDSAVENPSVKETKKLPVYDERFDDSPVYIEPVSNWGAVNKVFLLVIIVLVCGLLGTVLYFNSVNNDLSSSCRALLETQKNLQNKISSVEKSQDKLNNDLNSVRSQMEQLKRSAAKASDLRDVEEKIEAMEGKLSDTVQDVNKLQETSENAERDRSNTSAAGSNNRRNR